MPVEAIPVCFESVVNEAVQRAAEAINSALEDCTYIGHIAVTDGESNRYSRSAGSLEGIVLLVDRGITT